MKINKDGWFFMNNINRISFEEAILKADSTLNQPKKEVTSWLGKVVEPLFEKKIYLGYNNKTGWKVYELGFLDRIFRKLNWDYQDTHQKLVLSKFEKLTLNEASLITRSQLAKKISKEFRKKLYKIYDQKVAGQKREAGEQSSIPSPKETVITSSEPPKKVILKQTNNPPQTKKDPNSQKPGKPNLPPLETLPEGNEGVENVGVQSIKDKVSELESPRVTSPLFLQNYKLSRCYIDSVLEVMLSQDSIRQKIFDEYASVSKACAAKPISKEKKEALEKKKAILEKLCNLILIVHETKGQGTGMKSPIGKDSPAEKVRESIFASKLNQDLSDRKKIYSQQDASFVLLLINDLLGNGTIQTVVEDIGVVDKTTGETVTASRSHIDTTQKLELRFDGVRPDEQMGRLIDQLIPLLLSGKKKSRVVKRNQLIDQLIPLLQARSTPTKDLSGFIDQLKDIRGGAEDLKTLTANQLNDLKGELRRGDLQGMLDQFFTPEKALTGKGNEETRKFRLKNGSEVCLPFSSQPKIMSLSDSLTLHLSRSKFDLKKLQSGKCCDSVALPKDGIVDMTPYISGENSEPYKYEITGYVVHHGANLSSGHYTANIKIGDKFYACDDLGSRPYHKEISAGEFYGNKNAYLVMLKRRPNQPSGNAAAA